MSVNYVNQGDGAVGGDSIKAEYPTPLWPFADKALLFYPTVNRNIVLIPPAPSGWNMEKTISGGAGPEGVDSGNVRLTLFSRLPDPVDLDPVLVTASGITTLAGLIYQYEAGTNPLGGPGIDLQTVSASDNVFNPQWRCNFANVDLQVGDLVLLFCAMNTDAGGYYGHSISATGYTFSSLVGRTGVLSSVGNDSRLALLEYRVVSAPATPTPLEVRFAMSTPLPAANGCMILARLRDI